MSRGAVLVGEIASELDSWPGVRVEPRAGGLLVVLYGDLELGVLDRDGGVAELRFAPEERDALVEHGDAEPAEPVLEAENVSHPLRGPSDLTSVLALFDRRYRDVRGEEDPYRSQDPG